MKIAELFFRRQNHLLPFDKNPHLKGDNLNYQRFIILASPRTGSNYLVSLLKSHTRVICYGEVINPKFAHFGYPGYDQRRFVAFRDKYPVRFMEEMIFRKYSPSVAAVGFKIFYHHAREGRLKKIWPYLKELPDFKIIHLKRKNPLKSFLSYRLAKMTDIWQIYDASQSNNLLESALSMYRTAVMKETKIRLDYTECLNYFLRIQKRINQCNNFFKEKPILEVFYEDLDKDCLKEMERIQKFLNLETETLSSSLKKQNIRPLTETISNYWELKEKFKDTYWINFFDK